MATITIQGILYDKSEPIKVGKDGKEKLEYVVKETSGNYPNTFKVETFNLKTLGKANIGDIVEIEVEVKGREYEKNNKMMYFVSLVSLKEITIIEKPIAANNTASTGKITDHTNSINETKDDLPF
jgi:glycine cleavage system H lipoate-binding protein